jgi:adenosylcobinamide-GDP ribazoletransferase
MDKKKVINEYFSRLEGEAAEPDFLRELGRRFASVWTLLTRIPLPTDLRGEASLPSADALALISAVGALFALVTTLCPWLLMAALPPQACAWIACGLYTAAGWSLHLDGWGDLWDGFGSGRSGEAMRAVMKDSRIGSFGVAGIVLAIAIRATLLAGVKTGQWLPAIAVAGGVGRFALTVTAYLGDYPWDSGMGRNFVREFKGYQLFCSFLVTCLLFPLSPFGWAVGILLSSFSGALLASWSNKKLGGVNGDVLGASAVMGELIALACCVAV